MTQTALARIRYGADPELFLTTKMVVDTYMDKKGATRKKYAERPIPITGLVGGTKLSPLALTAKLPGWEGITHIPNGAKIQEDGTALEFNVSPAADPIRMLKDIELIMAAINVFAERKGFGLHKAPSATFTEEIKAKHPEAFIIGCDPDINAYTNMVREAPGAVMESLTRHAGGHFHVGYDKELVPSHVMVQLLDLFLGLPSLCIDKQGVRRQFYGQAGSFREKAYGVEYRSLSNFWLPGFRMQREVLNLLFSGVDIMVRRLITKMETVEYIYRAIPWKDVQTAINTENDTLASQILGLGGKLDAELFQHPLQFVEYARKIAKAEEAKKASKEI